LALERGAAILSDMKPLPPEVVEYIRRAPVCRIATVRPGGEPHVIPVCPVFNGETLYVDISPESASGRAVANEQRVSVAIDEYFDDWSKLRKVILRCDSKAAEGEEREAAWRLIREKFPQYKGIDWKPRLTLALRIRDWHTDGTFPAV
jgi:nitroimidazol reductase NimA-like FMN-containing flavoprotein (pyridoxamine 5'-phosphate oxidase superfamily)